LKKKALIILIFIVFTVNSHAQTVFDYIQASLANVIILSSSSPLENFDYDGSSSLLGTLLEARNSITMISSFTAGVEYVMLAAPHSLNSNIELKIYQGAGTHGRVVAKDTLPLPICAVRFTPAESGDHTIELINSSQGPAFISLIRLRAQRNPAFTLIAMAQALDITLGLSQQLATVLPLTAKIPSNQWSLFGGNVTQGQSTGYYNSRFSRGEYLLVGAGDRSARNIDVEVVEQRGVDQTAGNIVSINTGAVFVADFGVFTANPSSYYYPKVLNKSSQRSSAFCFGFLIQATED